MSKVDLTGYVIGKLTVLGRSKKIDADRVPFWDCLCECGKVKRYNTGHLRRKNNPVRSCGCIRFVIVPGMRQGKLVVVEKIGKKLNSKTNYWKCLCDCGNYHEVSGDSLSSKTTSSCGCILEGIRTDLSIGMKVNNITVVAKLASKDGSGGDMYLCECICGKLLRKEKSVLKRKTNTIVSCGCVTDKYAVRGLSNANSVYSRYRSMAKKRKLSFELTFDAFYAYILKKCHYCGASPFSICAESKSEKPLVYNGIDRQDSSVGYNLNNCVTCCKKCNYAKLNFGLLDFEAWVKTIYEHMYESGQYSVLCKEPKNE